MGPTMIFIWTFLTSFLSLDVMSKGDTVYVPGVGIICIYHNILEIDSELYYNFYVSFFATTKIQQKYGWKIIKFIFYLI